MRLFALTLLFAAPLAAQVCTFSVSPLQFSIAADNYTGSVFVTGSGACGNFIATSAVAWLHMTDQVQSYTAPARVSFTVDANRGAAARSAAMTIALSAVTVTQAGADCQFGLSPLSQSFTVDGGTGTANVQGVCAWQLLTGAKWITFPGITSGNPGGTSGAPQPYTVAPNACVAGRSGTITLFTGLTTPPPPTLTVTQEGSPANISLSANSATIASPASDGRISVNTGDGCPWAATTDASWLTIYPGSTSGTGNGGISYHALANTSDTRTGSIHVGALTYTITQLAPAAPPVVLSSVNSAASYRTDAVSPGEIVTLFGKGMGPATIATLQVVGGKVTNSLAGTQVLFDGTPATMIYTLAGQVSAVVPYAVSGKSSTQVQVQYQNQTSNALTVPVQAAHPAIFTLDASGLGPGAILNQDSSVNSSGSPATALSVVQIFATGGGITIPASADGAVTAGLFPLAVTPTVTIGGVNATVKFAGAAPGAVAGLTQINVEIPASLTPGISLPVVIKSGNFTSNSSVTIAVK